MLCRYARSLVNATFGRSAVSCVIHCLLARTFTPICFT